MALGGGACAGRITRIRATVPTSCEASAKAESSEVVVTVKDLAGGVLVGVRVELARSGTAVASVISGLDGRASFSDVVPGTYRIRAYPDKYFRPAEMSGLVLGPGCAAAISLPVEFASGVP